MRMYLLIFQFLVLLIHRTQSNSHSFRWMGVKVPNRPDKAFCAEQAKMKLLDKKQAKICRRRTFYMKYVMMAANQAISECKRLLKNDRWDCRSLVELKNNPTQTLAELRTGSRESAFVQALSAASLVYHITMNCRKANRDDRCKCAKNPSNWNRLADTSKPRDIYMQWGKCHDNVAFGLRFSKVFLDNVQRKDLKKLMVSLHNNEAGRQAVRESMRIYCQCEHILNQSNKKCKKICIDQLPVQFKDIADKLYDRYKSSRQVHLKYIDGKKYFVAKKGRRKRKDRKPIRANELVYLDRPRSFCKSDLKRSINGTRGRVCSRAMINNGQTISTEFDNCKYLCCGRGTRTQTEHVVQECMCKYILSVSTTRKSGMNCKKCYYRISRCK